MPAFKSILASVALMALAFSPIAAASAGKTGSLAARNANHVARSQVKASAALTKRANKAKRGTPRVKSSSTKSSSTKLTKAKVADPYAKGSTFLSTKAALAAAAIRCNKNNGGDAKCGTLTSPPENASGLCYKARCTFRCNDGFAPSGTACMAAASECSGVACPTVTDGYNVCTNGACAPGCFEGTTLYQAGTTYKCFATATDAANCGAPGTACPASYNGVGSPRCNNSKCTISCPAGSSLRKAQSTTNPFTCY
ncbi:hypothetical protein BCR35DRAFT_307544 [Leucosporidium creatinivorum]|uniref:Uncharacterized protein n=1 Tax=Leucosporidium creatinivorum TaxID=106004 RepID=A0A1Y2ENF8_9BASI|nr:hypothetical protein BCR35DRAFT_307544 [Leucosporidium creatinivorum]